MFTMSTGVTCNRNIGSCGGKTGWQVSRDTRGRETVADGGRGRETMADKGRREHPPFNTLGLLPKGVYISSSHKITGRLTNSG